MSEGQQQQQGQQGTMQLPPFRLYGLLGCPHCVSAEQFLRNEKMPALVIVGNDDPIAEAGIKAVTGKADAGYPVLVCTFGKQIVEGFKEDEYRKLAGAYRILFNQPDPALAGAGASDTASGGQQPVSEAAPQAAETVAGA